ncbi:MAG: hypothetical protein AVDCRST_MAG30-1278, partial [uncultured Solirubrobacteraceae bacterium]
DADLESLHDAIDRAGRGDGGASVVVEGPAGIGKTTLLRTALDAARHAGMRTALARASEFERGFGFGVVRQLFEPIVAEATGPRSTALFAGAARLARETLDQAVGDDTPTRENAYSALHALYWLCVNISDERPLVLGIDDLQWADAASLRWISFLARRIEGLPVLLIATLRTDGRSDEGAPADDLVVNRLARTVRPRALSTEAVGVLVAHELGAEPDPEFVSACHDATRGNPLFVRELLGSLRVQGVQPVAGQTGRVEEVGPAAVTRLVLHRLAGLGPAAERLARASALIGDGGDAELARGTADLTPEDFAAAAQRLHGANLVSLEPRVAFVHPVSRAAIVASLEREERVALARRAIEVLAARGDVEGVASHLLAVPPSGDAEAVATLRQAAARALTRGAPEAAVALLGRALVEPPGDGEQARVLHELGLAELRTRATVAPVHLRAALDLARDPPLAARIADDLARALHSLNRTTEAVAIAEEALRRVPPKETELRERLAARLVELARFVPDRIGVRRRVAGTMAAIAGPAARARVDAIRAYDAMLAVEPAEEVAENARRALHAGALAADTADGSMPVFLASMALAATGDTHGAAAELERVLDTARRRGSVVSYTGALSIRARVRLMSGDLRGAEADAQEIAALGDEGLGRDYVTGWFVESLVDQGRLDDAETAVEGGVLGDRIPELIVFNPGLHARGRLRLAQGRLHEGLADVLACGERQAAVGALNPADLPWRATAALALLELGRLEEADTLSAQELTLATSFGAPVVLAAAERVRGLVVGGDDGRVLIERAATRLEATDAPLEGARTMLAAGRARHATGDVAGARQATQRARELAERCGAAPLAADTIEALVSAGGRPRRTRSHGTAALTQAERRIAQHAAQGLSNREIAQALFVTEKTVEGHLSRAYRKLGITSRSQLPAAMRLDPEGEG